ncbi:MAG: ACT domain-containing protein [Filifactoraceae bacterium]
MKRFLVIDSTILPSVYEKVLEAKELIRTNRVRGVTEAVKRVDISRSTFYKYKDYIFSISEGMIGNKATISFLLSHEPGVLSEILFILAEEKANVLTINQDIPINKIANLSITMDMSNMEINIAELISILQLKKGVVKVEIMAME